MRRAGRAGSIRAAGIEFLFCSAPKSARRGRQPAAIKAKPAEWRDCADPARRTERQRVQTAAEQHDSERKATRRSQRASAMEAHARAPAAPTRARTGIRRRYARSAARRASSCPRKRMRAECTEHDGERAGCGGDDRGDCESLASASTCTKPGGRRASCLAHGLAGWPAGCGLRRRRLRRAGLRRVLGVRLLLLQRLEHVVHALVDVAELEARQHEGPAGERLVQRRRLPRSSSFRRSSRSLAGVADRQRLGDVGRGLRRRGVGSAGFVALRRLSRCRLHRRLVVGLWPWPGRRRCARRGRAGRAPPSNCA